VTIGVSRCDGEEETHLKGEQRRQEFEYSRVKTILKMERVADGDDRSS
jgi:hypothetical protein